MASPASTSTFTSTTSVASTSASGTAQIEEDAPKVYQLKVQLKYLKPPVWRRILVPSDFTFKQLHIAIQCAFGWSSAWIMNHLHQFLPAAPKLDEEYLIKPIFSGDYQAYNFMEIFDHKKVKLFEFLKNVNDKIRYDYDLGNTWYHIITLEKITLLDPLKTYPLCTGGRQPTPPEHILPESEDSDEDRISEDQENKYFDKNNISFNPPQWWIQKNAGKNEKHKYGYY